MAAKESEPLLLVEKRPRRGVAAGVIAISVALCLSAVLALATPSALASRGAFEAAAEGVAYPPFIADLNAMMTAHKHVAPLERQTYVGMNTNTPSKQWPGQMIPNHGVIIRNVMEGCTRFKDWPIYCNYADHSIPEFDRSTGAAASFWHNDIMSVFPIYPQYCPFYPDVGMCGNGAKDGYEHTTVGIVIGSAMDDVLKLSNMEFGDDGVFYATDSNSLDQRCRWGNSEKHQIYNPAPESYYCPGFHLNYDREWVPPNGEPTERNLPNSIYGSGFFALGNPDSQQGWGGGSGCHVPQSQPVPQQCDKNKDGFVCFLDQLGMDGYDGLQPLTDGSGHCRCNYALRDSDEGPWIPWVEELAKYWQGPDSWRRGGGYNPIDESACWVTSFQDMVRLQNAIYLRRADFIDPSGVPKSSFDFINEPFDARRYNGWNEVPLAAGSDTKKGMHYPEFWDAVFVNIPPFSCASAPVQVYPRDHISCLEQDVIDTMIEQLEEHIKYGALFTGKDKAGDRPGSSIALARSTPQSLTFKTASSSAQEPWTREFFCEDAEFTHSLSGHTYAIVVDRDASNAAQGCYLELLDTPVTAQPTPEPTKKGRDAASRPGGVAVAIAAAALVAAALF